jgi:hypothetical protein
MARVGVPGSEYPYHFLNRARKKGKELTLLLLFFALLGKSASHSRGTI